LQVNAEAFEAAALLFLLQFLYDLLGDLLVVATRQSWCESGGGKDCQPEDVTSHGSPS
jgi:hypothetical protein